MKPVGGDVTLSQKHTSVLMMVGKGAEDLVVNQVAVTKSVLGYTADEL